MLPDIQTLRLMLSYDGESGKLVWLMRPRSLARSDGDWRRWNKTYQGTLALDSKHKDGYRHGHILTKPVLAHRVAWALFHGAWPDGQIDHINGDRSDNRVCNLRLVGAQGNARNQKVRATNTSGCMGVTFHRRTGKWRVRINRNGRRVSLGLYATIEEAVAVRRGAEAIEGYHPNHNRIADEWRAA